MHRCLDRRNVDSMFHIPVPTVPTFVRSPLALDRQNSARCREIWRATSWGCPPYSKSQHGRSTTPLSVLERLAAASGSSIVSSLSSRLSASLDDIELNRNSEVSRRSKKISEVGRHCRTRFTPIICSGSSQKAGPPLRISVNRSFRNSSNHRVASGRNLRGVGIPQLCICALSNEQNVRSSERNPKPCWQSASASVDFPDPDGPAKSTPSCSLATQAQCNSAMPTDALTTVSSMGKITLCQYSRSAAMPAENRPMTQHVRRSASIELPSSKPAKTRWSSPLTYGFGQGGCDASVSSTQNRRRKSTGLG